MSFFDDRPSHRQRLQDALRDTRGLEKIVRKRGLGAELRDLETATAWAERQPWYSRLVRATCDARNWCWWIRPEGA